ncbi:hypothetical protein ACROYT_G006599 [Oculina patagonica]
MMLTHLHLKWEIKDMMLTHLHLKWRIRTGDKGHDANAPSSEGGDKGHDANPPSSEAGDKGHDANPPSSEAGDKGHDAYPPSSEADDKGHDANPPSSEVHDKGHDTKYEPSSFEGEQEEGNGNPAWRQKSKVYRGSDPYEHTSSHFAAFFLTAIVMVFAAYVVYHNRQKIVAIIIEGRNDGNSRRRGYRKLETNVEEAMPSLKSSNSTYVY